MKNLQVRYSIRLIKKKRKKILRIVYKFITNPKVVFGSISVGLFLLFGGILIDYIVAFLTQGYNIVRDYISDLGSIKYSPLPYLFNDCLMLAVIFFLPLVFYAQRRFGLFPLHYERLSKEPRKRISFSVSGFIFAVIKFVGVFGVGLFPEGNVFHGIFASLAFGGFIASGVCYGIFAFFFPTSIPRALGIYLFSIPLFISILYFLNIPPSKQFYEWLLFLSILGWLLPCSFILLKQLEREIRIPSNNAQR
ncbi:MAG: hypothetical protein RBG13Loki_4408 [Promethearchaeota archaeon CR_4]|nr:MAG: hypothetical protein RBG13Loki_4408 [Candidatus Lokiarchaeota archaeon CR_4]